MWDTLFPFISFAFLLALGYFVGSWRERRHLASLAKREVEYGDIIVNNLKRVTHADAVRGAALVCGDVVIASDYFKSFAARMRNIVGGEMRSFETLMNRARREATLRMLEEARGLGAGEVWNFRLETSNIYSANRQQPAVSVEVFAFGTAITRDR